jgi:hypothetical protein
MRSLQYLCRVNGTKIFINMCAIQKCQTCANIWRLWSRHLNWMKGAFHETNLIPRSIWENKKELGGSFDFISSTYIFRKLNVKVNASSKET